MSSACAVVGKEIDIFPAEGNTTIGAPNQEGDGTYCLWFERAEVETSLGEK